MRSSDYLKHSTIDHWLQVPATKVRNNIFLVFFQSRHGRISLETWITIRSSRPSRRNSIRCRFCQLWKYFVPARCRSGVVGSQVQCVSTSSHAPRKIVLVNLYFHHWIILHRNLSWLLSPVLVVSVFNLFSSLAVEFELVVASLSKFHLYLSPSSARTSLAAHYDLAYFYWFYVFFLCRFLWLWSKLAKYHSFFTVQTDFDGPDVFERFKGRYN